MKRILIVVVFILTGIGAYVHGQTKPPTSEEIAEVKGWMEQSCQILFPSEEKKELEKAGYEIDCICQAYANVCIEFMLEIYKNKEIDMTEMMKFIEEIQDPNSTSYNEFMSKFQSEFEKKCGETTASIMIYGPATGYVALLKYGMMYKLKVTLGSSVKYYLMDSGATLSLISKSYARELEKMNVITKKSYIGEDFFTTASGETIECKIVVINGVKVGEFSLDNVEFAVIDEDVEFLFGKNILNAFQSWHINNNNATLELVK
jgi:hypothetical protein